MSADGDTTPAPGMFEVPFGVGAFNSESDFGNADERERWLRNQPIEVGMVLAARAALRVIPALSLASRPTGSLTARRMTVIRVFRAVASAWAVSAFPSQRDVLREAARQAVAGLGNLRAPSPERAAAYALAAILAPDADIPARAATAVGYALDAAGEKGKAAFEITLTAIMEDAHLLSQRFSAVTIAHSQLWPGQVPDWAQAHWEDLKLKLLAENNGWEVWSQWYEDRLSGALSREQIEVARTTIPDQVWQQQPSILNRHIQELIEESEIFAHAFDADVPAGRDSPPEVSEALEQSSGRATSIGRITIAATAEVIPDPAIEAVVSRIRNDPQVFEDVARFAARSIERELDALAAKIPNEPGALEGYETVRTALEGLQRGFEALASSVHESVEVTNPVEKTTLLRKAARAALSMSEGFVDWLNENGNKAGRVVAELGLAGIISGTLSYFVGVPPLISFPVTLAAMEGKSIWEAIVLFAPGERKGTHKGD
jgi:hypothetical protein